MYRSYSIDMNVYHVVVVDSETGRQRTATWRTSGSVLQQSMGNSLWWRVRQCWRDSRLQESWPQVNWLVFSARQHYMLSALHAIARPFVCLSVTRVYHRKTVEVRIMKFSQYGSLQLLQGKFYPEILRGSPERERQTRVGWEKLAIFEL